MQTVSSVYTKILDHGEYQVESALIICDNTVPLANDYTDSSHKSLVSTYLYDEEKIVSISTSRSVFSNGMPEVGCCTCGEIDLEIYNPRVVIPPMARITPYVRLCAEWNEDFVTDGEAPRTFTATSTSIYSSYYFYVSGTTFSTGDTCLVEFDYEITGLTKTNAYIQTYFNGYAVSPTDKFFVQNGESGHHVAEFTLTSSQASATKRTRMRFVSINAGATITYSNVKIYNLSQSFRQSEWIRKGVFFIDSRNVTKNNDHLDILTLHGYDAMLKANADYPSSSQSAPTDIQAVQTIAQAIGVEVDPRTLTAMQEVSNTRTNCDGTIGYMMIEVLGYIGALYGGNFIINDLGKLQLIPLWNLPEETNFLTDQDYTIITFGTGANLTRIDLGAEA